MVKLAVMYGHPVDPAALRLTILKLTFPSPLKLRV